MLSHESIDGLASMLQLTAGMRLARLAPYAFAHSTCGGAPCHEMAFC